MQLGQLQEFAIRGDIFQVADQEQLDKDNWVQRGPATRAIKGREERSDEAKVDRLQELLVKVVGGHQFDQRSLDRVKTKHEPLTRKSGKELTFATATRIMLNRGFRDPA